MVYSIIVHVSDFARYKIISVLHTCLLNMNSAIMVCVCWLAVS